MAVQTNWHTLQYHERCRGASLIKQSSTEELECLWSYTPTNLDYGSRAANNQTLCAIGLPKRAESLRSLSLWYASWLNTKVTLQRQTR